MDEKVSFRVTPEQKNKLKRLADMSNKTLSDYSRDAALSPTLDSAKYEFYQSINDDILHLKKYQYVAIRLILLLGSKVMESDDAVMEFFNECVKDSETRFTKE